MELNVQDDDEFELLRNLLNNKQELEKKFKFVLQHLDQIVDILKDFLADKTKFKGANVKDGGGGGGLGLDKLSEALSTCDSTESLLETICSLTSETWGDSELR
jgi:mevalonate kinase